MNEPRPVPPIPPVPSRPQSSGPAKIAAMPVQQVRANDPSTAPLSLEPLTLTDEPAPAGTVVATTGGAAPVATSFSSKIQAFGVATTKEHLTKFKRPTTVNGRGACRVRTFHGRLSDEGLAYMDDKINEWMDNHPELEIKFATTSIGQYEGKIKEPTLIVNVWY